MLERLTPSRERGAVLAAGAVAITTFALLCEARFGESWDAGLRLLVVGTIAMLIGTLALLAPLEEPVPRPWQSVLYVADFVLTLVALGELADALGAESFLSADGTIVWVGLVLIVLSAFYATQRGSAIMTLLGAATAVVVVNEFFEWVADPSTQTHRWLLLVCAIVLALGAVALRDLHRRHAVALVDVAGLSIAVLGATLGIAAVFDFGGGGPTGPAGWELVLLATAFGLIAYGAVDRERVPEFIGVAILGLFVLLAGTQSEASLLWWPILLLLAGGALLAVGLRPRRSLPPEPPVPAAPPTEPTAVADA